MRFKMRVALNNEQDILTEHELLAPQVPTPISTVDHCTLSSTEAFNYETET